MGTLQSQLPAPRNECERRIAEMDPWFHNIRLPDGTQTAPHHPLGDFPAYKWARIEPHIPRDLRGWSVLDIGCNAGFYTLELARRGAFVHAMDIDMRYLRQAQWVLAQHGLQEQVSFRQGSVYDLIGEDSTYDLVWFMGVFYHLRYPLLALDAVARRVGRLLVFQTLEMPGNSEEKELFSDLPIDQRVQMGWPGWPRMAFIERKLAGDFTNWWAPDAICTRSLLRSAGLRISVSPEPEIHICSPDPHREDWQRELAESDFRALARNLRLEKDTP